MFNKSFLTNLIAVILASISFLMPQPYAKYFLYAGLFALSGAVTNQLAIHMLFEKIPFLYGSGIITLHFEKFKESIKNLMMTQFFTKEQLDIFFKSEESRLDLAPIVQEIDFSPVFNSLIDVVMESSIGKMLSMFAPKDALESLRKPFNKKLKSTVVTIVKSDSFNKIVQNHTASSSLSEDMLVKIEAVIDDKLSKITPQMVKEIIFNLMHEHLDWLVVWGGLFGGIIGVLSSLVLK